MTWVECWDICVFLLVSLFLGSHQDSIIGYLLQRSYITLITTSQSPTDSISPLRAHNEDQISTHEPLVDMLTHTRAKARHWQKFGGYTLTGLFLFFFFIWDPTDCLYANKFVDDEDHTDKTYFHPHLLPTQTPHLTCRRGHPGPAACGIATTCL